MAQKRTAGDTDHAQMSLWSKLSTTALIFLGRVAIGLYYELSGPSLPDLKHRVNSDYEQISRVLVAQNAAFLIGAIGGGFISDRYQRLIGLILFIAQVVAAIGTASIPFCTQLWQLALMFFLQGCGLGPMNSGGTAWIIWLWTEKSAAPVHSFHWAFGVGAFISPQLAKPFLSDFSKHKLSSEQGGSSNVTTADGLTLSPNITNTTASTLSQESRIEWAFLITAIATVVIAFCFLFLFYYQMRQYPEMKQAAAVPTRAWKDIISPAKCAGGRTTFGSIMVALIFTYHFLIVGAERSWGKFVFSFIKESPSLNIDAAEAADIQSTFWLCFFIGRGVATLIAHWIKPNIMVSLEFVAFLTFAILLAVYGSDSPKMLWICSSGFGLFVAPLFPGGIAVYGQYIDISAMILALTEAGAGFGGMLYQWISGYLLEYYGPNSLLYFNVIYVLIALTVYIIIIVIGVVDQRRNPRSVEYLEDEVEETEMKEKVLT